MSGTPAEETPAPARRRDVGQGQPLGIGTFVSLQIGPAAMVFERVSPEAGRVLGVAPEEAERDPMAIFGRVHPEDLPSLAAFGPNQTCGGRPFEWEGRLSRDGLFRRIRLGAESEALGDGTIRWYGTVEDVTEARHLEEELVASRAELAQAQRLAGLGSWTASIGQTTAVWSDQLYRILGRDPAMPRPSFEELVADQDPLAAQRRRDLVAEALQTGEPWSVEYDVIRLDGGRRRVVSRGEIIRDADGTPVALRGTIQDVTEARRSEEALRASEERFARVFGSIGNAIAILRPVRDEHGTLVDEEIEWANRAWRDLAGGDTPEPRGRRLLDIVPAAGAHLAAHDRVLATGEIVSEEVRTPSGRWLASQYRPFGDGVLVVSTDITSLRDALARADHAQRSEMVGRLAGGVAHEFNNLLAVVIGTAETLGDRMIPGDARLDDLGAIIDAGTRAADLTRQLLAFGRRQTLRPVTLDVAEAMDGLGLMLQSLAGTATELEVTGLRAGLVVRADRAQVEQVVITLVLTARDAAHDGVVSLNLSTEHVGADDPRLPIKVGPGEFVRLTVVDSGPALEPAQIARIFEPFYSARELGRGTGLGLSTVDGIIGQQGGFVTAERLGDHGTALSAFLPRTEPEAVPAPPTAPTVAAARGTLLLVEDEHIVRAALGRMLRDMGYTVADAADGLAALALVEAGAPFDILVTDVMMPGLNGPDLAASLSVQRPGLPVLFMSGYAPETVFPDGTVPSGAAFLAKPFSRADLATTLERLANGTFGT